MAAETAASPTFAELQRPLPARSARAWRFAAARAASHAGALLSDGLRIGYAHGFDSGPFMAHVYADEATGRTAVGRALDRRLLDMRTCVAFRDIRGLAETAVLDAADAVAEAERPPVIADLAAGPAPYLLHTLAARPRVRDIAGDIDPGALAALTPPALVRIEQQEGGIRDDGRVTLSIGMVQLPPVMISAPFKILLFVLVDGWVLTVGTLTASFNPA